MAYKKPPVDKQWKPGQSGNPSGVRKGKLTRDEVETIMAKFARHSREQLQAVVQNPKTPMLEIMVASVMAKAAKDGDYSRLDFLLNRSIGKVKDMLEVSQPKPFVVTRASGEQLVLGAEPVADDE